MIPNITSSAKEAAMEAAMETTDRAKEMFNSFYSQVSCSDLSTIQAECNPLGNGDGDGEGAVTLDWRADPFVSMSDLTLVVYDGSGGVPYHVHTLLLAYGGRKSGFIAEQVKAQKASNTHKSSTQGNGNRNKHGSRLAGNAEFKVDIYVPALAARHIPAFLDYVYGSSLELSTANAAPLRYLSNRFDVRDLHREVTTRFIPQDLELNTAPRYCAMADELKDFEMRDKSIRIMAERFEKMNVNLLKYTSPRMMKSLIQCDRLECSSETLSVKVAQYLRLRDELLSQGGDVDGVANEREGGMRQNNNIAPLTDEDYYWLTHISHMPKIHPDEGLFYFHYTARYPQVMDEVGSGSLKSRCLAACAESRAMESLVSHIEDPDRCPMKTYDELDSQMKVMLLESTLLGAKKAMNERAQDVSSRSQHERDVQLSDEIMYKQNANVSVSSSSSSSAKVVVLGCGIAPANGLYMYKGNSSPDGSTLPYRDLKGTIVYEKEAVWKSEPVTFILYPTNAGQYYVQYKLGVRRNGATGDDGSDVTTQVLYNSQTVMGTSSGGVKIPEHVWEVEEDSETEGLHPPPQFVGKVEAGQS